MGVGAGVGGEEMGGVSVLFSLSVITLDASASIVSNPQWHSVRVGERKKSVGRILPALQLACQPLKERLKFAHILK